MTAALPKAVKAQLEQAEQIEKALAAKNAPQEPEPPVEPPETEPPAEPQQQAAPEPVVTPPGDEPDIHERYITLKGKYDAEVPRLVEGLRERDRQITELSERMKQLEQKSAEPPKADPLVSDKDVEAFGDDMIDLVRRAAREEFGRLAGPMLAEIRKELTPVREQVSTVVNRQKLTEEDRFYQTLTGLVPDWEQINADQRWLEWLGEIDPLVGDVRQAALDTAFRAMDAKRTAAIFNTWKAQFQPKVKSPVQELQRQVSPSKSGASAPVQPAAKIWTNAEYQAAFDPRLTRHMSAAEIASLQAEADRAAQENRVRW